MNDDFENNLRDSLDRHAAEAAGATGQLGDVYARVDQRHRRRRSVAVIASVAVLAGAVAGFAVYAAGNTDTGELQSAGSPSTIFVGAMPTTTLYTGGATGGWACTGYMGSDGGREIYSDCVPLASASVAPECYLISTTTSSSTTIPMTTIPMTTIPGSAVGGSTGAGCAPPGLDGTCVYVYGAPVPTTISDPATAEPSSGCSVTETIYPSCVDMTVPITTIPGTYPPITSPPLCTETTTTVPLETTVPAEISPVEQTYVVVVGDSLSSIARMFSVDLQTLMNYNAWTNGESHMILPDDEIRIPPGARIP